MAEEWFEVELGLPANHTAMVEKKHSMSIKLVIECFDKYHYFIF